MNLSAAVDRKKRERSPIVPKVTKKAKKNSDLKQVAKMKDYNDFHIKGNNNSSITKLIKKDNSIQSIKGLSEIRSLEDKIGEITLEGTETGVS